jgi:hypothetical protein
MTTVHHKKKIHSNTLSIEEFKKIVFIQFRMQIINSLIYLFEEVKIFVIQKSDPERGRDKVSKLQRELEKSIRDLSGIV